MFPIPGHAADRLRYLNATLSSVHHLFRQHRVPVDTERLSGEHCRPQPLALPESCPLDSAIADHRSVQRQSRRTARSEDGHARPRPRWFGDIHRMNPQSNVTASTLALSTATMAPIAMKTVPRLAQRRPDSLFAVIFV